MVKVDDDWSDSDDDLGSDAETSVLLGVPDGAIEVQDDILDAAVSRIGGRPVRASITSSVLLRIQIHCVFLHAIHLAYSKPCDICEGLPTVA